MPCNSDYMEPSGYELRLRDTARLLVYLHDRLSIKCPEHFVEMSKTNYPHDPGDEAVPKLCAMLKKLSNDSPGEFAQIVYDAHSKQSRALADWWEEHQAADRAREQKELAEKHRQRLRTAALSKLTHAEQVALGLLDE